MADYLKYDTKTGNITDDSGFVICTFMGYLPVNARKKKQTISVDDMIKLKNSGFTAEEVIAIKKANL